MRCLSYVRHVSRLLPLAFACALLATPAAAIILGSSSALGPHMVRIVGPNGKLNCSGTVIDRVHVATAGHCHATAVDVEGRRFAVAKRMQTAKLEDGRVITVHGDAVILNLRRPLPPSAVPIEIGIQGADGHFTIAGFGATAESQRGRLGALHEAPAVVLQPFRLVDPQRTGEISASACYGDSGGAVLRNGALVGVITRASHPSPRKVCGHLTHYAPIVSSTFAEPPSPNGADVSAAPRSPQRRVMYPRMLRSR